MAEDEKGRFHLINADVELPGIGQSKHRELADRKSPFALAVMERIKKAMDPDDLFNPGKVL
jgi:FAD/FMN-containing dehydrogenase